MPQKAKTPAKVVQMQPRMKTTGVALDPRQAKALHQQDTAHLIHGFVPLQMQQQKDVPIFVKGQGVYLWDTEGRKYIDGLASLWNVHVGHGRKEINRAVAAQMDKLAFAPTLIGPTSVPFRSSISKWSPAYRACCTWPGLTVIAASWARLIPRVRWIVRRNWSGSSSVKAR